jgi:hypothetical protein
MCRNLTAGTPIAATDVSSSTREGKKEPLQAGALTLG